MLQYSRSAYDKFLRETKHIGETFVTSTIGRCVGGIRALRFPCTSFTDASEHENCRPLLRSEGHVAWVSSPPIVPELKGVSLCRARKSGFRYESSRLLPVGHITRAMTQPAFSLLIRSAIIFSPLHRANLLGFH